MKNSTHVARFFWLLIVAAIGGQLVSKSLRGFTSYMPGLLEKEGLRVAAIIFIVPFLLLRQFDKLFPFFPVTPKENLPE